MTTLESRQRQLVPGNYWRARNLELRRNLEILRQVVQATQAIQSNVADMTATAFMNTPEWKDLLNEGKNSLRKARGQRTKVLKFIAADADIIRVRQHLADACPPEHKRLMDEGRHYIDLMEAMGY